MVPCRPLAPGIRGVIEVRLLIQILISGITTGSIYAILAMAFGLIYNSTGAINFAQGEYLMLGGVTAGLMYETKGVSVWLSMLTALVVCLVAGLITELLGIRPIRKVSADAITIMTIGLALALKAIVMIATGRKYYALPAWAGTSVLRIHGAVLTLQSTVNVVVMLVLGGLLAWFLQRTKRGLLLRAAADDREILRAFGVSYQNTARWAFGIAAVVGAVAGLATVSITPISFDSGTLLGLKGFAAAMLGGLGSMRGAVLGGLAVGVLEAGASGYWSGTYASAVAFVVLVLVLVLRPTGLLGRSLMDRV